MKTTIKAATTWKKCKYVIKYLNIIEARIVPKKGWDSNFSNWFSTMPVSISAYAWQSQEEKTVR